MTFPADTVRRIFLDFFAARDHLVLPSSSLVPQNDPSVLFTSAGMQQFKPYYSGSTTSPHPRIATAQKCFRTSDIESVGDASHLTLFEMLGNFTFGDYFKREAITWAYELLTSKVGLDPDEIWITCFAGEGNLPRDMESFRIWHDEIGIPAERIEFHGRVDNFWGPTGQSGPCGPDSEIHYRLRPPEPGQPETGTASGDDRFIELWNLVFNQFEQGPDGSLSELPTNGVDTGAGFERWVVLMQDCASVYETDLYRDIVAAAAAALKPDMGNRDHVRALRTVAEHGRALPFLIADGVLPSNTGRGFILRRLLRRAVGTARQMGVDGPLMEDVCQAAIEAVAGAYPEVANRSDQILAVVAEEEDRFGGTMRRAISILDDEITGQGVEKVISGELAFHLHDTLGLPIEHLRLAAAARQLSVDEQGYAEAMAAQQERSRRGTRTAAQLPGGLDPSVFAGYDGIASDSATVIALYVDGESRDSASEGEQLQIVLDQTPFYGEAGGQLGDAGTISWDGGEATVTDAQKNDEGTIFHRAEIAKGSLSSGTRVAASIDAGRRAAICRNHTATHLLHAALRESLSDHARQAGSLVAPDHLRFDFNYSDPIDGPRLAEIEAAVNAAVLSALPVETDLTEVEAAIEQGAIALFGEKYGERVRMVRIGEQSLELCGGTHVANTAQVGLFLITGHQSIGSGVRRIEAVTGSSAATTARQASADLEAVAHLLGASPGDAPGRVKQLMEERNANQRELTRLKSQIAAAVARELAAEAVDCRGLELLVKRVDADDSETLQQISASLSARLGLDHAFLLGSVIDGRPQVLATASSLAVARGADSAAVVRSASAVLGGGGGGRADRASGGGGDAESLSRALSAGREVLVGQLHERDD